MSIETTPRAAISLGRIAQIRSALPGDEVRITMMNAVRKNGIQKTAVNHDALAGARNTFSLEVPTGRVTDQKHSGRCWMFAGLNLLREEAAKDLGLETLELSEIYLTFFEKLEKANAHLVHVLETLDEPRDGRMVHWLLQHPAADGGQWDFFVDLVEKYGLVPNWVMPETVNSDETLVMNRLLARKLREDTRTLRDTHGRGASEGTLAELKDAMIADVYRMLTIFLGDPPERFDLEWRDKDKAFHAKRALTPQDFYRRHTKADLTDYVSATDIPAKRAMTTYTVSYLAGVLGGRPNLYLNLDAPSLARLTVAQLEAGEPVWFGCDVVPMMDIDSGVLDADLYDLEGVLGVPMEFKKHDRLDYGGVITGGHNMLITGVNVTDGRPIRWKVENSWGDSHGDKGYFVMSDSWFREYAYQVVVRRSHLTERERLALERPPVVLPPWDPMRGLLAL